MFFMFKIRINDAKDNLCYILGIALFLINEYETTT